MHTSPEKNKFVQSITEMVHTTEEREELLAAIVKIKNALYRSARGALEEILKTNFPRQYHERLQSALSYIGYERTPEVKEFFSILEDALNSMRVARIELPFQPNEAALVLISKWLRDEVGDDIIAEFRFEPAIIGGAQITFGGRYYEYTLEKKIGEIIRTHKEKILKLAGISFSPASSS